jgi:type II secretory pathway pseudopilin PulG
LGAERYCGICPTYLKLTENPTFIRTLSNVAGWSMQGLHTGCGVFCACPVITEIDLVTPRLRQLSGMTTIELLIVITILGIFGAMVYPHFQYATDNADENVHKQQLRMIRMAIQMYQIQHGGTLPNLLTNWDDLTQTTAYKNRSYGPYLSDEPKSHKRSNVFDGYNVDPPDRYGFVYDYHGGGGTGGIWATNGSGKKLYKW